MTIATDYKTFLEKKSQLGEMAGFDPVWMPDFLFDFQRVLVEWAIRRGRAGIFADCGMGKTPMQLVWAENVRRKTGKPVLILTPLAVSPQTINEAAKFGIEVHRSQDGRPRDGITLTNYERLHHFHSGDFGGIVCDESSILKSCDGQYRKQITEFMRKLPYRLLATATAAPNDYQELGTSSEALGYLGHADMLSRFFKNISGTCRIDQKKKGMGWQLRGHAEEAFWRWLCSWSRALRRPSDLGFEDDRFSLPALIECEHVIKARTVRDSMLFDFPAQGLHEEREEMRRTILDRCEAVATICNGLKEPVVVWCHLNAEGDLLSKLISDGRQVAGSDSPEEKEDTFTDFSRGRLRVLITKPKIGAWGLNWQHCSRIVYFPSHSYEQYYQATRRCWRFGQTKAVTVDIVATESGQRIMENLKRKAIRADKMFTSLVRHMLDVLHINRDHEFTKREEVPSWL